MENEEQWKALLNYKGYIPKGYAEEFIGKLKLGFIFTGYPIEVIKDGKLYKFNHLGPIYE